MKRFYGQLVLTLALLVLIPLKSFSSHIVGGTLTYTYNGGNNYTVQLKLYRDCSGIAFPPSAAITVLQANGSVFAPSRNFTLPGGAITNIPAVLPPCATSPSVTPCVEERVYTATVNLAPSPGGMHLYYSLCCRNPSILNINNPSLVGETFYCYIPCYFDVWEEDFNLPNGTTSDAGPTAWTTTVGAVPPVSAQVNAGEFDFVGTANAVSIWQSQVVNISAFTNGVNLSLNARRTGTMQNGDSLKIFYSLNGGPKVLFPVNGNLPGAFATPAFATATGLIGNTIQLFVRATFNGTTTASSKSYDIDMATIYDNTFVPNSNPSFSNLPPLFVCSTNTFALNYSATDSDGDLLVYSMYTPYNDAPAPTFPNNTANIPTVTWIPNYSATSPFNSPAPAVTLNSSTGLLTGVANTNGQFVFGVKVQEYRSGKLLSETVRDYQMNTVTCPPFVPPPPTAGANTPLCIGQTLSLTASPVAGATYLWTGPNGFTSTLQNPTIPNVTALAAGVYSVQAIIAGCTGIAGTVTVTINPVPAAPTAGGNSPLCVGQNLSLTSSTIASATYNWSGPNTFTSSVQNPTITGVSTAAAGVYSVSATVLGCTGPAGTVNIVVNSNPPTPTATANSPLCVGQTLSLTSSTIAGATYNWSGPNSFTSSIQNPTLAGVTLAASGVYSVTATALGCISTTGTVNVVVNPIPAAPTAGSNSPLCVGQNLSLTSSTIAGATYNWSGPNSFTSAVQNPTLASVSVLSAGVYSVTATALGCTSPAGTVNVVVNPLPIAPTPTANAPICIGQTLNLGASTIAGATYNWSGPNSFSSTLQNPSIPGITLLGSGVYSVNATVLGCSGPSGTINVVVNSIPAAPVAVSNAPICQGQTLNLNASTIAGATYTWTGPNTFTSTVQNPSIPGITLAGAGVYSVSAVVLGCAGPAGTINVVVNPLPATPTPTANTPLCVGQTLNLGASTVPGATYNWTGPNLFSSTLQNPSIVGVTTAASGNYSVTASFLGCTSTPGIINVIVNPLPAAPTATANSPICVGQTLILGSSTMAGATYSWTGPNTFTSSVQNPTITGTSIFSAGIYSVSAVVLGCAGPEGTVNVVVNPLPNAPIPGSNSPLCEGQTLSLTASSIGGATYNWTGPNSFTSTTQNPTIVSTTTLASGIYSVNATVAGCAGPSGTLNVIVNPIPATPTPTANSPLCEGQNLFLGASSIPGSLYAWSGPNSFTSTVQNPTIVATTSLATGVYSVSATALGCTSPTGTVNVIVNPLPAPVIAGSNSPLCVGATLSLTASNIVGATYNWSGPNSFTSSVQNPTITNVSLLETGTYSLNVNVAGCTGSSSTVSVLVSPPVAAPTATANSPLCEGQDIYLGASTITGATYNWVGPNSYTSSVQNPTVTPTTTLSSGVYSVQATVAGCTGPFGTVTVTVNPTPAPPNPGSNSPLCEGQAINLTASTVTGATYNWSGPSSFTSTVQNPTIVPTTSLNAGTYSVNVTVGGCTSRDTIINVIVNPGPDPVIAGANSPLCVGATLSLTASNITGATYSWSGPNSFTASVQNPTITNVTFSESGTYSVNVTVAGCTGTSGTVNVVVSPPVAAPTATANSPVCEGQDIYLSSSTITGATYNWFGPNSYTASVQNPTVTPTTTLSAGIYSVQATVAGCSGPFGTISVTVNPSPAPPVLGSNSPICAGQTLSLTASPIAGATYSWSVPNSFTAATQDSTILNASAAASGDYSVTVIVAGCPSSVAIVSATVNPLPAAPTATANSPLCIGSTLNLGAGTIAGATYSWTGPNTFTSNVQNPTITGTSTLTSGVYSVTANVLGCEGPAGTVTVSVTDPAVVNAGPNDTICASAFVLTLNGAITTGYTGTWSSLGTGTLTNPGSLITTYTMSPADTLAGTITFVLTSSGGGCPNTSDTVVFTVLKGPMAYAGLDVSVCKNAVIPLNGLITGVTSTGIWSTTGTGTFNPNNVTLNGFYQPSSSDTASTSIQLILESTNNKGCVPARDTVQVNFINAPSAAFTFTNACANQPVVFSNGSTPTASISTYSWDFGDASGTSSLQNPTYTYTVGNTYTVTLVVTNNIGCTDTIKQTVPIEIAPVANFTYSNVCVGTVGMFNDASTVSSGTIVSWSWAFGDGGTSSTQNPQYTYTTAATYTVNLTVVSSNSCSGTATQTINVNPKPKADFSINPNPAYGNQTVNFNDLSTPTGSITGWTWNYGDGNGATVQNPSYIYDNNGFLTVQLAVKDANGCADTIRKEIIVVLLPQVPSAFTPNSDGANDVLKVKGGPFKTMYFRVYNNWGEKLFESTKQEDGWDGTYKGERVQLGVYVWILDVEMYDGQQIRKTGDVTILK